MAKKGLILVNTGEGKGKTTAALGTAVRAFGQGFKVAFLQFIKDQETGESRFLKSLAASEPQRLYYKRLGLGLFFDEPSEEDRRQAQEALQEAKKLIGADYDLVVLDECCVAMDKGLIDPSAVLEMLKNKPEAVNVILTGRGCPPQIVELADTVTEMTMIKHAYKQGIQARRGIEF